MAYYCESGLLSEDGDDCKSQTCPAHGYINKDYAELQRFANPVEDVTLVYDNETGTVLAVEDCMILTMHPDDAEALSEGTFDLETIPSPSSDLPATDGMNARAALALLEAASILVANAEVSPDPRMAGTTDCYVISLEDVDRLRQAITDAVGGHQHNANARG